MTNGKAKTMNMVKNEKIQKGIYTAINEIRGSIREYYSLEKAKRSYVGTKFRGAKFDQIDFGEREKVAGGFEIVVYGRFDSPSLKEYNRQIGTIQICD